MASPYKFLQAKWRRFWSQHWPRQTFVIVGSIAGVGLFYWPFISSVLFPMQSVPPEERHLYDAENTYYVKKKMEKKEEYLRMQKEVEERQNSSR